MLTISLIITFINLTYNQKSNVMWAVLTFVNFESDLDKNNKNLKWVHVSEASFLLDGFH